MIPSPHDYGYSPFENKRLNNLSRKGDIISNECLNSSAHKWSRPQLLPFFCENIASLSSELEISESSSSTSILPKSGCSFCCDCSSWPPYISLKCSKKFSALKISDWDDFLLYRFLIDFQNFFGFDLARLQTFLPSDRLNLHFAFLFTRLYFVRIFTNDNLSSSFLLRKNIFLAALNSFFVVRHSLLYNQIL